MEMLYNETYYRNSLGPIPYQDRAVWAKQFDYIAGRIIEDLAPRTVLDAGCAMGYLVEALRDRGVEAWGVDISDYAVSQAREDIRPYCAVGSLTDELPAPLPRRFDLVVSIEVLEHIPADEGVRAVHNLCSLADSVLFSSMGDDFTELTHVNVQQREYWAELFAKEGFFRNVFYNGDWLTNATMLFIRREKLTLPSLVADYEHIIRHMKMPGKSVESKVYFETGNNFHDGECTKLAGNTDTGCRWRVNLPAGCRRIRFDPVEGSGCLVGGLRCRSMNAVVEPGVHNGIELNDVWLFRTTDPWIVFDLPDENQWWLELEAQILPLTQTEWVQLCQGVESLQTEKTSLAKEITRRTMELEQLAAEKDQQEKLLQDQAEEKIVQLRRELEQQEKLLQDQAEEKIVQLRRELEQREKRSQDQAEEKVVQLRREVELRETELYEAQRNTSSLLKELQQSQSSAVNSHHEAEAFANALNAVRSSTSWRMTAPLRHVMDRLRGRKTPELAPVHATPVTPGNVPVPQSAPAAQQAISAAEIRITGHPVDPIATIRAPGKVRRLNLVTDTINASVLLGGVATALILATEFCRRYDYELRIITRNTDAAPKNYTDIILQSGLAPLERVSFYSDYLRFEKPVDFKLELNEGDLFYATSWWSAKAIEETCSPKSYFYIIQEAETFFYHYGGERMLCSQIMQRENVDFLINSHYLFDYFSEHEPNVAAHGCSFEPAFPTKLYEARSFEKKERHKLFFYSRPNNPRNLFTVGVNFLDAAIRRGVLDTTHWDICFVGQDTPKIVFCDGTESQNLGQLSWGEYAEFLKDVDLGLCLMYTPHPSYPPYDVACSGGVVLTNRMLNKTAFPDCANVIMADLETESFLRSFAEAVKLAENPEKRKANYESSTISRDWRQTLESALDYMGRCIGRA